jgi:glycine/D-amino acid oxidase-like deaminating enzyme
MDRRTLLKTGGMAVIGFGLSGCGARSTRPQVTPRRRLNLAPIRASWDRVIRTTVGLRPHRPSGFRLEAEKLDHKLVVHNYGHGGAGLSLSWGTGAMAADMALEHGSRRAAVLGSGAVGLAATRQLQRRGFDVTIYAMAVPPDVTTNMAWGGFTPTSGLVRNRTPAWDAQFRTAVDIAYRQYQFMAGREYAVSWLNNYGTLSELPTPGAEDEPGGGESEAAGLLPDHIRTGREILMPGEHPFPTPYATVRPSMRIEPPAYLNAMVKEVRLFGTKTVIRKFDNPRDLMSLGESVIVNCTGLGSRELFGDEELTPVKGQLTFLVPQPEVDYQYRCMPRSDGIALGSTREEGVWSLEPDVEARQRIVDRAIEEFARVVPPDPTMPLGQSIAPSPPADAEAFFAEVS